VTNNLSVQHNTCLLQTASARFLSIQATLRPYNIVQTHNTQYITKNYDLNAVRIIIFKIYKHHNTSYEKNQLINYEGLTQRVYRIINVKPYGFI